MSLAKKVAIIYGAGGPIGRAISQAYARAGARLFLSSRSEQSLAETAALVREIGAEVDTQVVDALSEAAVDAYVKHVVEKAGRIDISVNVIGVGDVQGTPLAEMKLEEFQRPIFNAVTTQFLTTRAAARTMIKQRSGVILTFGGGSGAFTPNYSIGGFQVSMAAVDCLRNQFASELGRYGIRALTIQSGGVLEAVPASAREKIGELVVGPTLLARGATFEDVGNAAVFAASDEARCITGTTLNITCGATLG